MDFSSSPSIQKLLGQLGSPEARAASQQLTDSQYNFVNYDDWYNGTRQKLLNDPGPAAGNTEFPFDEYGNPIRGPNPYVNDEAALKTAMANDLRVRGGANGLSDDQVLDAYKQMGGFRNRRRPDGGFFDQLTEFAGPGSPLFTMGSVAAGGGGLQSMLTAANASGATASLGVDPRLAALGGAAYGAYNSPGGFGSTPSDAVAGSEYAAVNGNAPNADYWNKTYAANDTGTMTDAVGNGGNMGIFDDSSGDYWMNTPDLGGGDGGAFDMGGSAGVFDSSGNPLYEAPGLMDLVKQYGPGAMNFIKNNSGALMSLLGKAAPAGLGAIGANQQANSLSALADKYMALGAPSRERYEASFQPGFTMMNDPGYKEALDQSAKATLHGLSVSGNPAGSPNAWAQSLSDNYAKTAYPALQNFRNTNANAGGIAQLQTAAPGAATGAIGAQGNVLNSLGAGLNDIFNPKPSLAQTLADYKRLIGGA